jgi:hypothetical protein
MERTYTTTVTVSETEIDVATLEHEGFLFCRDTKEWIFNDPKMGGLVTLKKREDGDGWVLSTARAMQHNDGSGKATILTMERLQPTMRDVMQAKDGCTDIEKALEILVNRAKI